MLNNTTFLKLLVILPGRLTLYKKAVFSFCLTDNFVAEGTRNCRQASGSGFRDNYRLQSLALLPTCSATNSHLNLSVPYFFSLEKRRQ